ncbi:MAG: DM13 domain-containing protein [Myxococcales bacterium]|nr:DM13 domain-containing protein [Myxococcales bacterium]
MSRRKLLLVGAAVVAPAIAFAVYWFGPHYLFINQQVNETAPTGMATVASGAFQSLEHETKGTASLVALADGKHLLRLDELHTSNGPELHVYLSAVAPQKDWSVYDDGEFVDLGPLKGNIGSANYEIPAGVDVSKYVSAVVWCRRFSVGFGVAPLTRRSSP